MAPSPPKRPRSRAAPPPAQRRKPAALPFDDEQVPSSAEVRASRLQAARRRLASEEPPRADADRRDSQDRRPTEPESEEPKFSEAFLFVERGPGTGQSVPIKQGLLFIGRASTSGLRIQHPSVSRRHAQLTRNGERFFIRDLASQNGTYVNQIRIDKEVEIFPGDELVMGTAQLRLRGPKSGSASAASKGRSGGANKKRTSAATVALAAGVVGFVVAAIVIFVWFKMARGPSFEDLGDAKPTDKPARSQPTRTSPPEEKPAPPVKVEETAPPPHAEAPEPTTDAKPADAKPEDGTADVADKTQPPPQETEAEGTRTPAADTHPAKPPAKTGPRTVAAVTPSRGTRKPVEDAAPTAGVRGDPTILARFEAGKLQDAIDLAKKKGAKDLLTKLTRFQTLYEAGESALAANDEAGALKNLEGAFKAAQSLSQGWDKYSNEIRHQLSGLHLLAGTRLLGREPAAARKELNTALQYDPDNAKAKDELSKLDPYAAPPKTNTKAPDKKAAIDEAFGN